MRGVRIVAVQDADEGMRLDRWFRQHYPQLRHGEIEKMLRKGQVRVDGGRVKANHRMATGEAVRIPPLPVRPERTKDKSGCEKTGKGSPNTPRMSPQALQDEIKKMLIFEDEQLLVLNKPYGLAVQGGTNTSLHLDGMLGAAYDGAVERPRLVHRLDRDTGGVLILGKTRKSAAKLASAFQKHLIEKEYWALCVGVPRPAQGTIKLPIAKKMIRQDKGEGYETVVPMGQELGKKAITDFQLVEEAGGKASFLALRPITGRTHQLRVHCAAMGHVIIGDRKYGGARAHMEGVSPKMHLFCRLLRVPHPQTGRQMVFEAPLTGHMLTTWRFFDFPEKPGIFWPEGIHG